MGGFIPFLPLYVRMLGVTDPDSAVIWSGLLMSGSFLTAVIFVPIWGTAGDKYGRKLMILRAVFGLGAVVALMGLAQNVWQFFLLRLVQGAVSGFLASGLAFVSTDAPREHSGYAIGIFQSSIAAGNIVGPFVGGVLGDLIGIRFVFYAVGILCVLSGLSVLLWLKEDKSKIVPSAEDSYFRNLKFIISSSQLRVPILLIFLVQAGINFTNPIYPYFVELLNAPPELLSTITGSLVGILGIMSISMSPFWGKRSDRADYRKTVRIAAWACAIAIIGQAFMQEYWMLYPFRIVIGIFFASLMPSLYGELSKKSPDSNKGGVMGFASSANMAGILMGYLLCGFTAAGAGYVSCFVVSAVLLSSAALLARRSQTARSETSAQLSAELPE